jgi:hypothetical protein
MEDSYQLLLFGPISMICSTIPTVGYGTTCASNQKSYLYIASMNNDENASSSPQMNQIIST